MLTPKVKVSFYMSGDDVDLDVLTEQIGIKPTKVRKKSEWPQVSISMGMAKDSWLLETEKEECIAVSTLFDKLQKILSQKNVFSYSDVRGIRIGEYFYVVEPEQGITVYSMPEAGQTKPMQKVN